MGPHSTRTRLLAGAGAMILSLSPGFAATLERAAPPGPAHDGQADAPSHERRDDPPPHRGDRDGLRGILELPPAERRARFREFLLNRLERLERSQQAIRRAMRALDDGDPIDEIIRAFPPDLRPGPRGPGPSSAVGDSTDNLDELGPVLPPGDQLRPGPDRRGGIGGHPDDGGHRAGGRPGAGGRDAPRTITDADRRAFDLFLAAAAPDGKDRMASLRQKSPERADRLLVESMPRIGWLLEMHQRDPELFQLRLSDIRYGREALEASRALAAFDRRQPTVVSEERDQLVARLRSALENQYEIRGKLLAREIERLDRDVAKRRAELTDRPASRDAAIERAIERLRERAANPMPGGPRRDPD